MESVIVFATMWVMRVMVIVMTAMIVVAVIVIVVVIVMMVMIEVVMMIVIEIMMAIVTMSMMIVSVARTSMRLSKLGLVAELPFAGAPNEMRKVIITVIFERMISRSLLDQSLLR